MPRKNNRRRKRALNQESNAVSSGKNDQATSKDVPGAAIQPHTEKPDAVESQASIESAPELALVYIPSSATFMLMRGAGTMQISAKEMAGIFALPHLTGGIGSMQ